MLGSTSIAALATNEEVRKTNPSLKVHKLQKLVMQDERRFRVIVAGRRWGKSQLSKISLIRYAASKSKQLIWYVAPTYQQARDIMWEAAARQYNPALG